MSFISLHCQWSRLVKAQPLSLGLVVSQINEPRFSGTQLKFPEGSRSADRE